MNQTLDFWIILIVKLLLLIGFIAVIKFWIRKNKGKNMIPMIVYWILGIFFVLVISFQVFEAALLSIPINPENVILGKESLKPLSTLLGLIFYIYIGVKYLKK